jgi:uroporphyrinogen-III synthase
MKAIVTRPAAQADAWVARLRSRGVDAVALPLIAIGPPPDPAAVAQAWAGLAGRGLVVFVSPNAAERFFAARPDGAVWPAGCRAASLGPGTTQALRDAGVPAAAIVAPAADAAQFDSEALWAALAGHAWAGRSVLAVRGDGGREWLADRLREAGAAVTHVAAYQRAAPVFDAAQRALLAAAQREAAAFVWLFSSSEAIDHLEAIAGAQGWSDARAVATHPRIAERARRLGIVDVREARPDLAAVVACIQSFRPMTPP